MTLQASLAMDPEPARLSMDLGFLGTHEVIEHLMVTDAELDAVNTENRPDRVAPRRGRHTREGSSLIAELPPVSWSIVRVATTE